MQKDLAIVILNWNGKQHLEEFLPSVVKFSTQHRIILADNNSTDNSVDFVKKLYPEIEIVQNTDNGGYAKGYNDALKKIEAKYYCLLNSDVEVTENWTDAPIRLLTENPKIAACQPKLKSFSDKNKFEYAGAAGGFIDQLGFPFCRGRIFNSVETDNNQYNDEIEIFWASGACLFIKSEIFHRFGGFDVNYFAHMEEIDLCWRLKNKGYSIYYCGKSTVYHLGGGTLSNINPKKTFLNFRNSLLTLYKNEHKKNVRKKIFIRLLLDGVAAIKFLLQGQPAHFFAVIKAHRSFYKLKNTMSAVSQDDFLNHPEIYQKWIIVAHFIKGKNSFHQLKNGFINSIK